MSPTVDLFDNRNKLDCGTYNKIATQLKSDPPFGTTLPVSPSSPGALDLFEPRAAKATSEFERKMDCARAWSIRWPVRRFEFFVKIFMKASCPNPVAVHSAGCHENGSRIAAGQLLMARPIASTITEFKMEFA